jgi:hypothetical protein
MAPTVQSRTGEVDADDPQSTGYIAPVGDPGLNHLDYRPSRPTAGRDPSQFARADEASIYDEPDVSCCYARGNKHWTKDPQGIAWEAFHTLDSVPMYDGQASEADSSSACGSGAAQCCGPSEAPAQEPTGSRAGCCA